MLPDLDTLTADLNAADLGTRWRAVEAIGQIDSEAALDVLISALSHADDGVRWRAAKAIGRYKHRKSVYPLIEMLLYDHKSVASQYAAASLVATGDKRAIHPLRLEHHYSALASFGSAAIPELLDALNTQRIVKITRGQWQNPDDGDKPDYSTLNKTALAALHKIVKLGGHEAEIVRTLERLGWKPETLDERIAVAICLEDTPTLTRIGSKSIPAMINLMNSTDTEAIDWQTRLAAKVLRQINTPEARAAVEAWERNQDAHS